MWQTRLVASILQQALPEQAVHKDISGSLNADSLLQIYRHNYYSRMQDALQSTFGKTEQMLGAGFFDQVGRDFILASSFKEASLLNFGAEFPQYLRSHTQLQNMLFVADLAALEWAMEEVYNAARPLKSTQWQLNTALRLVPSEYALLDIWQYTGQGNLDVSHQEQWVLAVWLNGDIRLQGFSPEQGQAFLPMLLSSLDEQQVAFAQLPEEQLHELANMGVLVPSSTIELM